MDEVNEEIEALECEGDAKSFELNSETGIALARLVASLGVTVFAVFGWTIEYDLLFNIFISIIAVACLVYGLWYKNANLTKAAQTSQKLLDALKKKNANKCEEGTE